MPFSVIYADPPLVPDESVLPNLRVPGPAHFPIAFEELAKYPVQDLADDDAVLFLWATGQVMPEAIMLMDDWGIPYRGIAFVWNIINWRNGEPQRGAKRPTRINCKFLLYGVRGDPLFSGRDIDQIVSHRSAHLVGEPYKRSHAPVIFRDKIDELVGYRTGKRAHLWANEIPEEDSNSPWKFWAPGQPSDFSFRPKK